jgi:putative hydrolase of the HAD superfamily
MDLGMRKPDQSIFQAALRQTGLEAEQCLYVGDTLSRDVEGSRRAGFGCSVFMKSGITEQKDRDYGGDLSPDYTIGGLEELVPLLLTP